ncbi:phospholipid carrier-dependent glycosyltransferase [Candidatus Woesebacteria bacterium]|nr:phospholipid carrier-dependent glycosyltransferase [Candidatus Woesebacteria bacterium]
MFSWFRLHKKKKLHIAKDHWVYAVVVGFILFLAAFTRLWQLGSLPVGLTWDEAALGYIGQMVVTTGMDEHFDRLPIVFQSFGDYKAPLAMYITGIFTASMGLHVWVVRLPYALAGIASIALMMWIVWQLTNHKWYAILAGWLMVIAPWHILFSRVAFESGLALLFVLAILAGWLEVRNAQNSQKTRLFWWAIIVINTVASIYVYHSTKLVVPLLLATIGGYELVTRWTYWRQQWRTVGIAALSTGVLLLPFVLTVLNGTGLARASQTTVFAQNEFVPAMGMFLSNFAQYFSVDFLAQGATDSLRHSTGARGVFLWSHLLLLVLGVTFGLARPVEKWAHPKQKSWQQALHKLFPHKKSPVMLTTPVWLWILFLIIGLLPAAIGVETPHPNRALLALPAFIVLMVSGARELQREFKPQLFVSILSGILLLSIIEWASFWQVYRTEYRAQSAAAWMEGYEEAVLLTHSYIADNKRTKFTSAYGEPEIFFAFYNQVPFHTYREFRIPGSVQFGTVSILDTNQYDVVIAPGDTPLEGLEPVQTIYRSDESVAFYVYETR